MYALVSMALSLILLVILLHLKVRLGRAMIVSAIALALLLRVSPGAFWNTVIYEWQTKPLSQTTGYLFITLTALVMLVNVLGTVMKQTDVSTRLVPALQELFKSRRLALAAIPMFMGLLPTPGGIMLSAPMVRDLGDTVGVRRERLAAINYLFRHQWETIWPLFPSVPLIQGMLGISAFALISHNLPIMLAGTLGGVIFLLLPSMPPKGSKKQPQSSLAYNLKCLAHAFWPILLVAILNAAFNLPAAAGLLLAILAFLVFHKVGLSRWSAIFKSGLEPDFALLILGALLFKLNLEATGAIADVVNFLTAAHVPERFVIFFLPLLVSFLTGVTMPTVAITLPFLIPFIGTGPQAKIGLETLAFSGLICGLLITPVHLCLALSESYFQSSLLKIILKILPPTVFVAAAGELMAMLSK
jgi:integral membrane protein (TIGR00529 family)